MKKSRIILETKGDNPGEPLRKCKNYKNNSASQIKQSNFYHSYVLHVCSLEYGLIFFGYLLCRLAIILYHLFPRIFFLLLFWPLMYAHYLSSSQNISVEDIFTIIFILIYTSIPKHYLHFFLFTKRVIQVLFKRSSSLSYVSSKIIQKQQFTLEIEWWNKSIKAMI